MDDDGDKCGGDRTEGECGAGADADADAVGGWAGGKADVESGAQ